MVMRLHPFSEFTRLFDDMDRFFRENDESSRSSAGTRTVRPAIDLYDTGQEFVLRALMPGVSPDDINLSMEQNTLHISGNYGYSLSDDEARHTTWYRREIGSGKFMSTIQLPMPVDSDGIEATMENGLLTLHLPKASQAQPRRIDVKSPKAIAG